MATKSAAKTSVAKAPAATTAPASGLQKYVRPGLGIEQISKLKECFDIFDYDHSGNVSPAEFKNAITALGLQNDAAKILSLVSAHSHGDEIDFEGFLEIFGFSSDTKSETTLQSLFEEFDKEGKGHFTEAEFALVADSIGERFSDNEITTMIQYADKDKDGVINFNDFVEVATREYPKV